MASLDEMEPLMKLERPAVVLRPFLLLSSDCASHFSNQSDIYKVARVDQGNWSDNRCNQSDTWPSESP